MDSIHTWQILPSCKEKPLTMKTNDFPSGHWEVSNQQLSEVGEQELTSLTRATL